MLKRIYLFAGMVYRIGALAYLGRGSWCLKHNWQLSRGDKNPNQGKRGAKSVSLFPFVKNKTTLLYILCMKEQLDKYFNMRVPKSLWDKFRGACDKNYKTASEAIRDLMQRYVKETEEK